MARPYTVELPDGGSVTVNANSAADARTNAGVGADAPVHAGGQKSSGEAEYNQPASGPGSSYATGSSGTAATAASGAAAPGMNWGYEGSGQGGEETDQTKAIYGRRGDETLDKYMRRTMQQAARAASPNALNPYLSENPNANSPYARWFQERYGDTVPANIMLNRLLSNGSMGSGAQDFEPYMEGELGAFMGGKGRGFGQGMTDRAGNLGKLNDIISMMQSGNEGDLSTEQRAFGGAIKDDPRLAMMMVNGQLDGAINPFGMEYVNSLGSDMTANYFDDPVGQDPSKKGPFLTNYLKKLGVIT